MSQPFEPEEVDVIVGMLAEDLEEPSPGSIQWDADCGHKVWLSVSSQRFLVQYPQNYEVSCMHCIVRDHT